MRVSSQVRSHAGLEGSCPPSLLASPTFLPTLPDSVPHPPPAQRLPQELISSLPPDQRTIALSTIADRTKLPLDGVEFLLMKVE